MPNILRPNVVTKKNGVFTQKANRWKSLTTITRVNNHLGRLARQGKLVPIRQEERMLIVSVPEENAIYTLYLKENGCIEKITRI